MGMLDGKTAVVTGAGRPYYRPLPDTAGTKEN